MWEINIGEQLLGLSISILLGGALCLFYGLFSAFRRSCAYGKWGIFFQDILFFSISAVITFIFLTALTNGEVRGYFIIGEVFGFIIIKFTIFRIFTSAIIKIISTVKRIFADINNAFYKILSIIFTFLLKKLKKLKKLQKNS